MWPISNLLFSKHLKNLLTYEDHGKGTFDPLNHNNFNPNYITEYMVN